MEINRIMLADSYKYSQPPQYPSNMVGQFAYMEARSSKVYPVTVWAGLQGKLKTYFSTPITMGEVHEAEYYAKMHGIPFNFEGWHYIATTLGGKLPIRIKAVPEGSIIPNGNVLMTIESTDPKVPWVPGWMETFLMKVWYPSTVATKAWAVRKILDKYAKATQDTPFVLYSFHNFGDRGSSSVEAASEGGMGQLIPFMGTDNFHALKYIMDNYGLCEFPGHSIPATEHSTITSWGRDEEFQAMMNYLETYKDSQIIACVMDSYNIYNAVNAITTGTFKNKIESDGYPIFVIRPDSGDPLTVLAKLLQIMENNYVQFTVNKKGFKVFNKYRFIWGDGISPKTIEDILSLFVECGYSTENIAFGSGGDLMQKVNRDTLGFAIKCSSITVGHEHCDTKDKITVKRDVFKDPITDQGKTSKRGELMLYQSECDGHYETRALNDCPEFYRPVLETIYENGKLVKTYTFDEVRLNFYKGY